MLGDEIMAAALIDRLLHHCHIVNIRGNSYRMRAQQDLFRTATNDRRQEDGAMTTNPSWHTGLSGVGLHPCHCHLNLGREKRARRTGVAGTVSTPSLALMRRMGHSGWRGTRAAPRSPVGLPKSVNGFSLDDRPESRYAVASRRFESLSNTSIHENDTKNVLVHTLKLRSTCYVVSLFHRCEPTMGGCRP